MRVQAVLSMYDEDPTTYTPPYQPQAYPYQPVYFNPLYLITIQLNSTSNPLNISAPVCCAQLFHTVQQLLATCVEHEQRCLLERWTSNRHELAGCKTFADQHRAHPRTHVQNQHDCQL